MTNKIIKFPYGQSVTRKELEKQCIKHLDLNEEEKKYAKQIIEDIVEEYYPQTLEIEIKYPPEFDAASKESFLKYFRQALKKTYQYCYSKFIDPLVIQIIFLKIEIYRLKRGLE